MELYVFDREAVREVDRRAAAEFGIPGLVLMENAARHAADVALEMLEKISRPRVLIVCGGGNNAGDGFAVARHLSNAGAGVSLAMLTPRGALKGDAAINADIAVRMEIPTTLLRTHVGPKLRRLAGRVDLIVDAMLGTGLTRPVSGRLLEAVRTINQLASPKRRVLALDLPSGLDADTGDALGEAVRAHTTATFAGLKRGFFNPEASQYVGDVVVCDIGVPRSVLAELGSALSLRPARSSRYHR